MKKIYKKPDKSYVKMQAIRFLITLIPVAISAIMLCFYPNNIAINYSDVSKTVEYVSKYNILAIGFFACVINIFIMLIMCFFRNNLNEVKWFEPVKKLQLVAVFILSFIAIIMIMAVSFRTYLNVLVSNVKWISMSLSVLAMLYGIFLMFVKYKSKFGINIYFTLQKEIVWKKTHLYTGIVVCIIGAFAFLMSYFYGFYGIIVLILGVVFCTIFPIEYGSYLLKREILKDRIKKV